MSYNQGLQELDDITAIASNEIILKPGFHAQNGSRFVAKIEDCASVNLRVRNTTPRDSITDKIRAIVHQADSITLAEQNQIRTSDTLLNASYRKKVEPVNIYPNPTTGEFTLQLADSEPAQIRVYNSLGSIVLTKEVFNTATIDLGAHRKGIYYIEVQQNQRRYSEKLVHH
ncbi:T9SS type A sorting domain-containing protein [Flavobacteriales bacterium]|nr:T9SS type A sorting domain-containing protein [Flavobacteriales bacterium]